MSTTTAQLEKLLNELSESLKDYGIKVERQFKYAHKDRFESHIPKPKQFIVTEGWGVSKKCENFHMDDGTIYRDVRSSRGRKRFHTTKHEAKVANGGFNIDCASIGLN
jgi:hypothetical protein